MDTLLIVTGGSAGFGRAVLAGAPTGTRGVDISRSGGSPAEVHVPADLADPASWPQVGEAMVRLVADADHDRITFVHSAGTLDPIGFAGEVDTDAMTRNVLLNSAAAQVLGHRFLEVVATSRARRELVLVSSGAARPAYPGWSTYGAGKAAIDQWVRTVGLEQQDRGGVKVLAVAPGVLATRLQTMIRASDARDFPRVERFRDLHASGRLVDPADAAERLWQLLDDDTVLTGSVVDLRGSP